LTFPLKTNYFFISLTCHDFKFIYYFIEIHIDMNLKPNNLLTLTLLTQINSKLFAPNLKILLLICLTKVIFKVTLLIVFYFSDFGKINNIIYLLQLKNEYSFSEHSSINFSLIYLILVLRPMHSCRSINFYSIFKFVIIKFYLQQNIWKFVIKYCIKLLLFLIKFIKLLNMFFLVYKFVLLKLLSCVYLLNKL
jgi:hypothetical protein